MAASDGVTLAPRSRVEIARFLVGLGPVGPGVVRLTDRHRGLAVGETVDGHAVVSRYGAVARKR
ncbi:SAM-dependent methyltransferase [Streptomyces sp. SMS_SU21]|uniref:SAM-dependent methyltransferase n=1 Tax=Streptomyces sp. SMS_SU21 TaxID=2069440 RepID=UPI000C882113|nr:SAM-dependent methyltransferase [Streptomyces sp. SMS_SU21]MCA2200638.1 SAM-dependent methyltransferase [Streptomyces sp. SMS_SU21]